MKNIRKKSNFNKHSKNIQILKIIPKTLKLKINSKIKDMKNTQTYSKVGKTLSNKNLYREKIGKILLKTENIPIPNIIIKFKNSKENIPNHKKKHSLLAVKHSKNHNQINVSQKFAKKQ